MTLVPLLVMRENAVVHACLAHEKSAEKTLETQMLWEVHPTTQRTIPADPRIFVERVCRTASWYVAYVGQDTQLSSQNFAEKNEYSSEIQPSEKKETAHDNAVLFLNELYDVVSTRNAMRPTGSYTTHLFESGAHKIRKKLAEEVTEVILAQSEKELTLEVADLLYHLVVLLVESDVSLRSCIEVLQARHSK